MHRAADTSFGQLLRRYRLAAGLSQEALAERAALSVRTVMYLERHAHTPYPATILRLARALALSAEEHAYLVAAAVAPDRTAPAEPAWPPRNPYKGLRAFGRADASDFFGRDGLIASLLGTVGNVTAPRFLAVIGPSGSGKSSVVLAGLLPQLQRGAGFGSERWIYLDPMVPGAHPLEALTLALSHALPDRSLHHIRADLDSSARGLHVLARHMAREPDQRVVLVVDQCEELFTLTADDEERRACIALLATAASEPAGCLQVVITLRADFCDRPLAYPALGSLLETGSRFVLPLTIRELRAAIERPAALADVQLRFEDGLIDALLADVYGQVGALPLLQFTLAQLVEQREGRGLTLLAYDAMGGVRGALVRHAEGTYAGLPSDGHRQLARSLFLRLIDPGATERETIRRRASVVELVLPDLEQNACMQEVVAAFTSARLLTASAVLDRQTVEVSHEALICEWWRLADWLREAREDMHLQQAISADAAAWERHGRPADRIYRGTALDEALMWAKRNIPSAAERAFLTAGMAEREQTAEAARAQHARELALARHAAAAERRAARHLRQLVVALTISLLVTVGLAALALNRAQHANEEAQIASLAERSALARQLAAQALNHLPDQYDLALLLAAQATRVDNTVETRSSLVRTLEYSPLLQTLVHAGQGPVLALTARPRTRLVASGGADGSLRLWDAATGRSAGTLLRGEGSALSSLAFSADGMTLAAGYGDGRIRLWDLARHRPLAQAPPKRTSGIMSLAFSGDGAMLAATDEVGSVLVWDLRRQRSLKAPFLARAGFITSLAFSSSGRVLATGGENGAVELWNLAGGATLGRGASDKGAVSRLAFSPDGKLLAAAALDGTISVWGVQGRPRRLALLSGHTGSVTGVAFSRDGLVLASASTDTTVRLWDMRTGQPLSLFNASDGSAISEAFTGHQGSVNGVTFSADDMTLVSGGNDGTLRFWNMAAGHPLVVAHGGGVTSVAYDARGKVLASGSDDKTIRLWDTVRGRLLATLRAHTGPVTGVAFSRSGLLASGSSDHTVRLWDVARRVPVGLPLKGFTDGVSGLAFAPDGRTLAAGSGPSDGTIRIWSVPDGTLVRLFKAPGAGTGVGSLSFSPDGHSLVAGYADGLVRVWVLAGFHAADLLPPGAAGGIVSLAFSPEGGQLAAGSMDGHIYRWSTARWGRLPPLAGHVERVSGLAFSPDGTMLASTSWDYTVRFWDAASGQPLGQPLLGPTGWPTSLAYRPDGASIAVGGVDTAVRQWPASVPAWRDLACRVANRNLTREEWRQYLAKAPYRKVCPMAP